MKRTLALLAVSFLGLAACQPSKEQIKSSVDAQLVINKGIDSVYKILENSYETYHAGTMDAALEGFSTFLNKAETDLKTIKPLTESGQLTSALEEKIAVMKSIAANQAVEQVRIYKLPDTVFTDDLRQKWDKISKQLKQKISEAQKKIDEACSQINKSL
ncbi:MAG: hypothetical protein IIU11_02145 [Bacteroidales bacterium]|nr:hypothetical protein [Bacteroidales bacterium]